MPIRHANAHARKPRNHGDSISRLGSPLPRGGLWTGRVTRLEQLTALTEADLLQLHGMGPKAMEQLRRALADRKLAFKKEA